MGYSDEDDERRKWLKESKYFELAGALRLDFFNQPKYIIPGVDIRLLLKRSKDEFALFANAAGDVVKAPQIDIKQATLYVRRVKVAQAVQLGHQIGLLKRNATYPYTRSETISTSISKGSLSFTKDNLFGQSLLPKFVVVGMVNGSAYNGNYLHNPFNFEHFNIQSLGLYRDGQSLPYRQIYEPRFNSGLFTKEYVKSIIQNTQHFNTNLNNGISMDDFKNNGYSFFTFNLTPDFDMTQVQQANDGNLRLDIKFTKPLAEPINVIVYATFDAELQITKDKEVIRDRNVH